MAGKAGMFVYALAFLLGIIFVQQQSVLPDSVPLISLFLSLLFLFFIARKKIKHHAFDVELTLTMSIILLILIGMLYSSIYAGWQLSHRLDEGMVGQNIIVNGTVSNIPVMDGHVQRFELSVDKYRIPDRKVLSVPGNSFPEKIKLSWYYGSKVNAGDNWQLEVRLKPPHGFMNPGGFDYEKWLFQHGVGATGYVRKSVLNLLDTKNTHLSFLDKANRVRQKLGQSIDAGAVDTGAESSFSLIKALAIGDKSAISNKQWRVLTSTGTSHLMAISGLHVGLAALFAYSLIRRLVPATIMQRVPAQHIAVSLGLLVAALYAVIAGLSIPTQRAIIMLSVLVVMALVRRNHRPFDALGLALVLVLLFDPLAVLSVGFWFSFSAVAVIFISLNSEEIAVTQKPESSQQSIRYKFVAVLKQWVRLQLLISLFLLPLSLFMFQQASLVSPLANLILIPYVSFLVVPIVLFAIVCSFVEQSLADALFGFAATLLDFIWPLLSYLSTLPHALLIKGDVDASRLLLATAAMLLLYFSKSLSRSIFIERKKYDQNLILWSLRLAGCLMFAPMIHTNDSVLSEGEYRLTVLDVGQGSAAVIRTQNHALVFDAGAKFSDRLDIGSSVVIPYLRSQGVTILDRLLISHGDADHIGGARAILDVFPDAHVVGQDIERLLSKDKQLCRQGLAWSWDGVVFTFLSPDMTASGFKEVKRNDRSCVLKVDSRYGSALLTGDIERAVERSLLGKNTGQLASNILVVPHHGSNTSSSIDFIRAVNPEISLISAGYKNRYKLPSKKILARYVAENRDVLNTSENGAITVSVKKDKPLIIERYRNKAGKYWHHNGAEQRVAISEQDR